MNRCILVSLLALTSAVFPATASASVVNHYADLWWGETTDGDGNTYIFGSATAEVEGCDAEGPVTVYNDLYAPGNTLLDSNSNADWCYASTGTQYLFMVDESSGSPDGDYESRGQASLDDVFYGCVFNAKTFEKYQVKYQFNRRLEAGDYEYVRVFNAPNCNTVCTKPRVCSPEQKSWVRASGTSIRFAFIAACTGTRIATDAEPMCYGPFGSGAAGNDGCSGDN
jgi:hypothetical protein